MSIRWTCPALGSVVRVEFSGRLRSAVARCSPKRGVIRLSTALLAHGNRPLLSEALTHEAAHFAVHLLHGPKAKPHGNEWRQLMQAAGLQPRLRLRLPDPADPDARPRVPQPQYEYRCPVCQSTYRCRRRDSRIRCRPCVEAGLTGLMTITRRSFTAISKSR
ncbi:MAG: SprT-like domain-containing protein [Verrucomicrobiales bacterium]|nr:SprT-like domain-containing protein [Verrucomicrobiales bacterium]